MNWEDNRQDDIRALTAKGILPMAKQAEEDKEAGGELDFEAQMDRMPLLMGQASGAIEEIQTAQEIMESMMALCIATMRGGVESVVVEDVAEASARL